MEFNAKTFSLALIVVDAIKNINKEWFCTVDDIETYLRDSHSKYDVASGIDRAISVGLLKSFENGYVRLRTAAQYVVQLKTLNQKREIRRQKNRESDGEENSKHENLFGSGIKSFCHNHSEQQRNHEHGCHGDHGILIAPAIVNCDPTVHHHHHHLRSDYCRHNMHVNKHKCSQEGNNSHQSIHRHYERHYTDRFADRKQATRRQISQLQDRRHQLKKGQRNGATNDEKYKGCHQQRVRTRETQTSCRRCVNRRVQATVRTRTRSTQTKKDEETTSAKPED